MCNIYSLMEERLRHGLRGDAANLTAKEVRDRLMSFKNSFQRDPTKGLWKPAKVPGPGPLPKGWPLEDVPTGALGAGSSTDLAEGMTTRYGISRPPTSDCQHIIAVSVTNNPNVAKFLHALGFNLDNAKNGTFLSRVESKLGSGLDGLRHAGNHPGYRKAMEAHLAKMSKQFDDQVSAWMSSRNINPAQGLTSTQAKEYQDIVAAYQKRIDNLQGSLRSEMQSPSDPVRRLVASTDPIRGNQTKYETAWAKFLSAVDP